MVLAKRASAFDTDHVPKMQKRYDRQITYDRKTHKLSIVDIAG
jgi:hypothetical protein